MSWPVSGAYEARTSGVTTVKKAWADALDTMINALWSGTKTLKALQVDGTGYQAAIVPSGEISTSGNITAGTNLIALQYTKAPRYRTIGSTSIQTTDWSLDASWGVGATVDAVSGDDTMGWVKITAAGAPGINPVATMTFKDGTWTTSPRGTSSMRDTDDVIMPVSTSATATTLVLTLRGTPTAGKFYTLQYFVMG